MLKNDFKTNVQILFNRMGQTQANFFVEPAIQALSAEQRGEILLTAMTNLFRYCIDISVKPDMKHLVLKTLITTIGESFDINVDDPVPENIFQEASKPQEQKSMNELFDSLQSASEPLFPTIGKLN